MWLAFVLFMRLAFAVLFAYQFIECTEKKQKIGQVIFLIAVIGNVNWFMLILAGVL